MRLPPGIRVGPYAIEAFAGSGASGTVYRARHVETDAAVALKLLDLPAFGDEEDDRRRRRRFAAEAHALARLERHPHVVGVHAAGLLGERVPWIALEWMPGGSLRERMAAGAIAPREGLEIGVKLASALAHLHDAAILHRDVKPENVLFDDAGEPRLGDFGVVRDEADLAEHATRTGAIVGTPAYLAPEGFGGADTAWGPWTDIWSLGVLLHEAWTGRRPFDGDSLPELFRAVQKTEPASLRRSVPELPRDAELICRKALEKDPVLRYRRAAAIEEDLRTVLAGGSVVSLGVSRATRVVRLVERSLGPRGAAALALLAISLATLVWALGGALLWAGRPPDAADATAREGDAGGARPSPASNGDAAWLRAEHAVAAAVRAPDPTTVSAATAALATLAPLAVPGGAPPGEGSRGSGQALRRALERAVYEELEVLVADLLGGIAVGRHISHEPATYEQVETALTTLAALGPLRTPPPSPLDRSLAAIGALLDDADIPDESRPLRVRRDLVVEELRLVNLDIHLLRHRDPEAETDVDERHFSAIVLAKACQVSRWRHEREHRRAVHACPLLAEGLALADRSLAIVPTHAPARLERAKMLDARGAPAPAVRAELRRLQADVSAEAATAPGSDLAARRFKETRAARVLRDSARLRLRLFVEGGRADPSLVDEALADVWLAATIGGKHAQELQVMVGFHIDGGRPEAAIEVLERAAEEWPWDWRIQEALALVFLRLGRDEEAAAHAERARAFPGLTAGEKRSLQALHERARRGAGSR